MWLDSSLFFQSEVASQYWTTTIAKKMSIFAAGLRGQEDPLRNCKFSIISNFSFAKVVMLTRRDSFPVRGRHVVYKLVSSGIQMTVITVLITGEHRRVCPWLKPQSPVKTSSRSRVTTETRPVQIPQILASCQGPNSFILPVPMSLGQLGPKKANFCIFFRIVTRVKKIFTDFL